MSRNQPRSTLAAPRAKRTLRVERLEDRSLLAVSDFSIVLREDLGGAPGEVLAAGEIDVGDCFYVEILARENHPYFQGLHGVALNIEWDAAVLEEIDPNFDPAEVITTNLPLFQRGTLDNPAGTIDNLSGSAFHASGIGRAIGNGAAERFALLHFRAESAAAATSIRLSEGASSIVTQPAATFSSAQLDFEVETFAISAAPTAAEFVEPTPELIEPPPAIATPPEPPDTLPPPELAEPPVFALAPIELPSSTLLVTAQPEAEAAAPATPAPTALPTAPQPAGFCTPPAVVESTEAESYAAAVEAILMGPLTPEQFSVHAAPTNSLRLQDLLGLLAIDIVQRRKATVINVICE